MPGIGSDSTELIINAVKEGALSESDLDLTVSRVIELLLKMQEEKQPSLRTERNDHILAGTLASESAVLLKNEDHILPVNEGSSVAFLGQMAKEPRYQGAGSSKIHPYHLENALQSALDADLTPLFAPGYDNFSKEVNEGLLAQAVEVARQVETAVVFAGLPDEYESEGFDRTDMNMPKSHVALIEAVAEVNPNTIVVLQCGSPVSLPWADKVKGILLMYLAGEAGGSATIDLLFGKKNPCGKLAETWPLSLADTPTASDYPGKHKLALHKESIYVGYRYYDAANCPVAYPFGYGLSYTDFEYSHLVVEPCSRTGSPSYRIRLTVKNIGTCAGKEIVQLYIAGPNKSCLFRAPKVLKNFAKVLLQSGEEKEVLFTIVAEDFAYYNDACDSWCIEGGCYSIQIGSSSRNIALSQIVSLEGDGKETLLADKMKKLREYQIPSLPLHISNQQFELLIDRPLPSVSISKKGTFSLDSTFGDIKDTLIGKIMLKKAFGSLSIQDDAAMKRMVEAMMFTTPIRSMRMAGGMSWQKAQGIVDLANGHYLKGIKKL